MILKNISLPLKCTYCTKRFKLQIALNRHLESSHKSDEDQAKKYSCHLCEFRSNYKENVNGHFKRKHDPNAKIYKCEFCDYQSTWKYFLKDHINMVHTKAVTFDCDVCNHKAYTKSSLASHKKHVHEDIKKFKCQYCPFEAKVIDKLRDHTERRHEITTKSVSCQLCDFVTKTAWDLKLHMKSQHDENRRKIKCSECDYSSHWRPNVTRHFRHRHQDIKEFKCTLCQYEFATKIQLKSHRASVHKDESTNIKKYVCDICRYSTISWGSLNRHLKTHQSVPRIECSECHRSLKNGFNLLRHMKNVHGQAKIFPCEECGIEYKKKVSLEDHIRAHHSGKPRETFDCKVCRFKSINAEVFRKHKCNDILAKKMNK